MDYQWTRHTVVTVGMDDIYDWAGRHKWPLIGMSTVGGLYLLYRWRSASHKLPPGPWAWPLVGNLYDLSDSDMHLDLNRMAAKYGDVFTIKMGPTPTVVLNSYKVIRDAFVHHGDMFASRPLVWLCDFLPNDIMMSPYDDNWAKKRKMVMSAMRSFGHGSSQSTEEKIQSQMEEFMKYISKRTSEPIDVSETMPLVSVNILCNILFNHVYELDDPKPREIIQKVRFWYRVFGEYATLLLLIPAWIGRLFFSRTIGRKMDAASEACRQIIRPIIYEHIETLDEDNPRDFLDMFIIHCKKRGNLDIEEIANSTFSVMPDGIDTGSSAMEWTILYLTLHPRVQKKVQDEVDRVIGSRTPHHRDRPDCPYTEAVIMETLRIVSPVLLSLQHSTKESGGDFMGYHITQDHYVLANFYAALHDPEIYEDPHEYRPERYIDDDGNLLRPDTWMPFGLGRRGCIAEPVAKMEVFLMITNLLQSYNFDVPKGMAPPTTQGKDEVIVKKPVPYKIMLTPRE